jgi:hypothetical protein
MVRQRVQKVCGGAKKVLCQSKDGGSRCNEEKSGHWLVAGEADERLRVIQR